MNDTSTPQPEGDVNGDILDLTAWDHQPGDRDLRWYRGRGTDEGADLSWVNQPSNYGGLKDEEKAALQKWIATELRPGPLAGPRTSYPLKHVYERLTGHYVTNGQFKGAMLAAGYEPVDRTELSWNWRYVFADPQLFDRSLGRAS